MAQRVRDILLRIRGDASDAQQDLHDLASDLKRFDGITAEATVDINATAANRKIEASKKAVQDFGRLTETAKIDLQERAAQVKLDRLRQNLDNLQKKEITPKVEIAIGRTVAQIERVEAQLDKLDRRRVDINVDVDRRGSLGRVAGGIGGTISAATQGFAAFASVVSAAAQSFGAFVSIVSRGFGVLGGFVNLFTQMGVTGLQLVGSFAALGAGAVLLIPLLAGLVVVMGQLISVALGVVAIMAALAASLLSAAAGVGVLAVALAAAFGPVLLVAIAAMARFAKILEAVKAAEDGVAEGARGVRDANRAQAVAQRTAVDAAERVRTTAVDAYRAWRDAAEETSDAIRGITDAELSRERAQLTLKQAKQDLAEFRRDAGLTDKSLDSMFKKFTDISFRPKNLVAAIQKSEAGQRAGVDPLELADKVLRVREAQQGVVTATDGVSDAVTRANDAREKENEFLEKGIAAYEPYTAAVEANEDAQRALKRATEDVADAHEKQNEALKDLTPREKTLVGVIVDLKDALADAFRPATRRIFDGVIDFLKDVGDFAKDPAVRRGFRIVGDAIGDAFRIMGRELRRREVRDAFGHFAEGAGKLIRHLSSDVFRRVFRILLRIGEEALPWLIEVAEEIGGTFRGLDRTLTRAKISDKIDGFRKSFKLWWRVATDVWDIVKLIFGEGGAKQTGDQFARRLHRILEDWKEWLRKNPDKIKEFFDNGAKKAGQIADSIESVAASLETIANLADILISIFNAIKDAAKAVDSVKGPSGIDLYNKSGIDKIKGPSGIDILKAIFGQSGGMVPGAGRGDIMPAMLEPGEYVVRRSVVQAVGVSKLNLLNAGNLNALSGSRAGMVINEQIINLPPAPGHSQLGDPRHQAVQLARELRRRGGQGITGGGIH